MVADLVLSIDDKIEYDDQNIKQPKKQEMKFKVRKNKSGEIGIFSLEFLNEILMFENLNSFDGW